MAQTYHVVAPGITFSTALKSMLSLFNAAGSGRVIRITRIWAYTFNTAAVTGILQSLEIRRITAVSSGGTPVTQVPVKCDTNSEAIPAQITFVSGNTTVTSTDVFRTVLFSSEEPATNTAMTGDEFFAKPQLNCIFDSGYGEAAVEPLTCREGTGIAIICPATTGAVSNCDIIMEFTMAAS